MAIDLDKPAALEALAFAKGMLAHLTDKLEECDVTDLSPSEVLILAQAHYSWGKFINEQINSREIGPTLRRKSLLAANNMNVLTVLQAIRQNEKQLKDMEEGDASPT